MRKSLHNSKLLPHKVLQEVRVHQLLKELQQVSQVLLLAKDLLQVLKSFLKRKRNKKRHLTSHKSLSTNFSLLTLRLTQATSIQTSIFDTLSLQFALTLDTRSSFPFYPKLEPPQSSKGTMTSPERSWWTQKS